MYIHCHIISEQGSLIGNMKKNFDPFKNLKLDAYEQEIEDYVNNADPSEFRELSKFERALWRKMAINTEKYLEEKKKKNINIRIKESDLKKIKLRASISGLPYQTLIATLIHQFCQGRIDLKL